MKPERRFKGDPDYSPHYVNGNKSAPQMYELRLAGGEVLETRPDIPWPIAELEKIAQRHNVAFAESVAVSGFGSWCMGSKPQFTAGVQIMPIPNQGTPATRARLARLYVACIGYNPFDDCPNMTAREVLQTLKEWRAESRATGGHA